MINQSKDSIWKYIILFILTFLTCSLAGAQWSGKDYLEITNWQYGLTYAILIMTFLTVHEFGHYFAARYHKIHTSLPYYIPFPVPIMLNFGTFGAVMRIRQHIPGKKELFDIGIAGPIAGYLVSVIFLIVGIIDLPTKADIFSIHPDYVFHFGGIIPETGLFFGDTLIYSFLSSVLIPGNSFVPPMNEIYHFPFLNVGWFGLFVTTMNLLPMGQLDGGHIIYSMFGSKIHYRIARITMWTMIILGSIGSINEVYMFLQDDYGITLLRNLREAISPSVEKLFEFVPFIREFWSGWLLWALIGRFLIKLRHPPVVNEEPIGKFRMILGWFAIFMLISSFSHNAFFFK